MATSILEAMAFGLPIVSRPVGGIVDYFIEGEMGYLIPTLNAQDFYEAIRQVIVNPKLTDNTETNHRYALGAFPCFYRCQVFGNGIIRRWFHPDGNNCST